ncbi:MAG TPA: hypothetical protein VFD58_01460 [Blastocatellia bacterium]|nr:hypothetical protein [Blastocatellia bacterium]
MNKEILFIAAREESILNPLARVFAEGGRDVMKASSGNDAVEAIEHNPVTLILSDQSAPGMNDVFTEIWHHWPDCIVLPLTGDEVVADKTAPGLFRAKAKPWFPWVSRIVALFRGSDSGSYGMAGYSPRRRHLTARTQPLRVR